MTITYRAAYWVAEDCSSDVCLTLREDAHLPDAELMEKAMAMAESIGLEVGGGEILIGDYTE